jgi:hypothetical protein
MGVTRAGDVAQLYLCTIDRSRSCCFDAKLPGVVAAP